MLSYRGRARLNLLVVEPISPGGPPFPRPGLISRVETRPEGRADAWRAREPCPTWNGADRMPPKRLLYCVGSAWRRIEIQRAWPSLAELCRTGRPGRGSGSASGSGCRRDRPRGGRCRSPPVRVRLGGRRRRRRWACELPGPGGGGWPGCPGDHCGCGHADDPCSASHHRIRSFRVSGLRLARSGTPDPMSSSTTTAGTRPSAMRIWSVLRRDLANWWLRCSPRSSSAAARASYSKRGSDVLDSS